MTSTPRSGNWAFSVLDGQMAVWRSAGPGQGWSGPHLLPGTGLDQGAHTVVLPDGRIAVFGTRTVLGSTSAEYTRQVVYAIERAAGSDVFSPWRSLGAPATGNLNGTLDFSGPAVTVDKKGHLSAYVRDGDYTLRARVQINGDDWTPWKHLGGTDLQGDPTAVTLADGTTYVLAPTGRSVLAWTTTGPAGALRPASATGLPATTLPLTVAPDGDGVRLWFRKPGTGDVLTDAASTGRHGLRLSPITDEGGPGGFGPVSTCGRLVADRTAAGTLGFTTGSGRPWNTNGPAFTGGSSAICRAGESTVGVVGQDALLHTLSASTP
ncbi:hypothetical protein ACFCXT_19900 [Streptomyces vinaceus]|uniref:hypothetical protein n=1 Tax=Streptomyces vinaceus TaxID=1960 RepID=UPI0035DF5A63